MAEAIPFEHIQDAHSLLADGEIFLYEINPLDGGTIRLKADNSYTWRGNLYEGVPLVWVSGKRSANGGSNRPTLTIGDENTDLGPFKPFLYDGLLDGALVTRYRLLVEDLTDNRLVAGVEQYRVKHIPEYSRTRISLDLATFSDSLNFSMPFKAYYSPAFPSVSIE